MLEPLQHTHSETKRNRAQHGAKQPSGDYRPHLSFPSRSWRGVSWGNHLVSRVSLQFLQRQISAVRGNILPNPCGSRSCAANYGAQTLPRNFNSSPAEATVLAALGRRVIQNRQRASWLRCSVANTARQSSPSSCTTVARNGGAVSWARNNLSLSSNPAFSILSSNISQVVGVGALGGMLDAAPKTSRQRVHSPRSLDGRPLIQESGGLH